MVVNFAAESHVDRSITGARAFVETNVLGVQVLLDACLRAGVARVIQVSTDEVYGSVSQGSWAEGAALEPNSPYAASKAGGDMLARAYANTHGLDVRITRCCNNYGPYQFPEKVIPLFITNLLDGLRSRSTATAATSATGFTSRTTAGASSSCWSGAPPAVSTTSAGTASFPTWS